MTRILLLSGFLFLVMDCVSTAQISDRGAAFYSLEKIQNIEIKFEKKDWNYTLDSLRLNGDNYLLGDIVLNGTTLTGIGVRRSGPRSVTKDANRPSLEIALNLTNHNQTYEGLYNLRLSGALRDPSMIREVLGFEIARDYMTAPRANYARVSVNGEPLGLMINIQPIDVSFLLEHFGHATGALIKADPPKGEPTPSNCKKEIYCSLQQDNSPSCSMRNFVFLNNFGEEELDQLIYYLSGSSNNESEILAIDPTLWMLAFNNVLVNLNSYSGDISENYFLYYDSNNGLFYPFVWDLNLAFGSFKNTGIGSDLDLEGLQTLTPLLHEGNVTKPLINKLLQDPMVKKTYLSHIRTILYDWFLTGKYKERAEAHQRLIKDAYEADPSKQYPAEEFAKSLEYTIGSKSKIPGIAELMEARTRFLKKFPDLAVFPPEFKTNILDGREKMSPKKVATYRIQTEVSKFTKRVVLYYRFEGEKTYRSMPMMDDGKSFDEKAGDNIFGVEIKPNGDKSLEYYFFAENASAVSFDPPNYYFDPHTVNLSELNK